MNIFKRLFVLSLLLLATACGTAQFSGKSGKKADAPTKLQDNESLDPIPCTEALNQASSEATTEDQTPVQNADASTDDPNQSAGTETTPQLTTCPVADADQPAQN